MPDDRLSRLQDAEFQDKLDNLKASVDPAKAAEIEDRIERYAALTKKAREAMRLDRNSSRTAKRPSRRHHNAKNESANPKPPERALIASIVQAETATEMLDALSRWCWIQRSGDTECPATRIASMELLTDEIDNIKKRDQEVLKFRLPGFRRAHWTMLDDDPSLVALVELPRDAAGESLFTSINSQQHDPTPFVPSATKNDKRIVLPVEVVHKWWLTARQHDALNIPHPLAPVVAAWQQIAAVHVKADHHPHAILSESLRDAQRIQSVLPLSLDHDTPLGTIDAEPEQGYLLPEWEPRPSLVPLVSWLTLYDLSGTGPIQSRGRGAPLAQRLFVEVLTAVHVGDRDPEWITAPPITLRDLFEWCWPRWYDRENAMMRGGYQRNKHLPLLRRALVELDNFRIRYDRMDRRLIRIDDLPNADTALDEPIRFHVRHLPGSDRGPAIDRVSVRRWGLQSAPAYRSTIRLAYLWDEAKGRNNGHRIYATRPAVARVAGPGSPLISADGEVLRDRHGAVVKNWNDPRAVILGTDNKPVVAGNAPAFERNPAADRVPMLGPDDIIRLAFDDDLDLTSASRRKRLERSREALTNLEAAGEVVVEHDGGGMRIIESRPDTWSR